MSKHGITIIEELVTAVAIKLGLLISDDIEIKNMFYEETYRFRVDPITYYFAWLLHLKS